MRKVNSLNDLDQLLSGKQTADELFEKLRTGKKPSVTLNEEDGARIADITGTSKEIKDPYNLAKINGKADINSLYSQWQCEQALAKTPEQRLNEHVGKVYAAYKRNTRSATKELLIFCGIAIVVRVVVHVAVASIFSEPA